ncbi:hypothetical protein [Rhizobium sp. Leaf262]|uniref:hypothetical protein n=1 Tax=Rhizobium sp. Leaf262 TaxID=1736312 RepID=UPI0007139FAD|nr:hypothetical protein [Rhizobium sp. Leaf262]KQO82258.1 hypothetical protein ASF29_17110 [Rhizobium sp. Leaf262]
MSVTVDGSGIRPGGFGNLVRVLLVSLVAIIGWNIPVPGLDPAFVDLQIGQGVRPSQFSVLALSAGPLLAGLALGQVIRLIFPRADGSGFLTLAEDVLIFAFAVSQANSLAQFFSATDRLVGEGALVAFSFIGALVGGTAVMLFLSRQVVLPSLRAGLWILWLLPGLLGLPSTLSSVADVFRSGAASDKQLFQILLITVFCIALCTFACCAVIKRYTRYTNGQTQTAPLFPLAIVVWPPILAAIVGNYVFTGLAVLVPQVFYDDSVIPVYFMAMTTILSPLFVFGYSRIFARKGFTLPSSLLLLIAATQIALVVGTELAINYLLLMLPLSGSTMLVAVVVCCALVDACLRSGAADETCSPA